MINSNSLDTEIQQLQNRITSFIVQLQQHGIKTSVVKALEQIHEWLSLDAGYWFNLNVYSALSVEQFVKEGRTGALKWQRAYRYIQYVEYLRNAAIFLPILYTWFELSRATRAYGALLTQQPELRSENLLFLWQSGTLMQAGTGSPSPFSVVALVDVLIIFAIILLSLAINIFRDHQDRRREGILDGLAVELGSIAWEVNHIFMRNRRQFFETAEERTITLLNGLENFVVELKEEYQDTLERTSRNAEEVIKAVSEQVNVLADQNVKLASMQKSYLENLTLKIDQLLLKISTKQDEWTSQLTRAGDNYQQQWEQIISQWKEELDKLTLASNKQMEQFSEARSLFGVLRENMKSFQKAAQQLIPVLENAHKGFAETASSLNKNQTQLIDSLQSLEGSLRSVEVISLEWSKEMDKALTELGGIGLSDSEVVKSLQSLNANDREWKDLLKQHIIQNTEILETLRSSSNYLQSIEAGDGFKGNHEQSN